MIGNKNEGCTPILSAKIPWNSGIIAPPTIAKHKIPEPWLVCFPSPWIAKLKIVGNIIELHSPTNKIATIARVLDATTATIINNTALYSVLHSVVHNDLNRIHTRRAKTMFHLLLKTISVRYIEAKKMPSLSSVGDS